MKLIIDIPKEDYEFIKRYGNPKMEGYLSIQNGTPLACVKAEIESEAFTDLEGDTYIYVPYLFKILDNIGKAESEDE